MMLIESSTWEVEPVYPPSDGEIRMITLYFNHGRKMIGFIEKELLKQIESGGNFFFYLEQWNRGRWKIIEIFK